MSVKRCVLDENALMGGMEMFEDDEGDYVLHSDYAALIDRHNALRDAVAWEREFDEVLVWLVRAGRYPRDMASRYDLANEREYARAEVDRLIADCKGEG